MCCSSSYCIHFRLDMSEEEGVYVHIMDSLSLYSFYKYIETTPQREFSGKIAVARSNVTIAVWYT